MRLLLLFSLLFSTQIFANDIESIRFTFWGNEGRNRIFLSCDYAQGATKSILKKLNVAGYSVNCHGGIDVNRTSPVSIGAKFRLPAGEQEVTIESDFRSNCFYETRLIDEIIRKTKRIKKVSARSHCFRSNSKYKYKLKILK